MLRVLFLLFCALSTVVARADETATAPDIPATAPIVEDRSTRTVAPGIELTTIRRNTPDAPLQIFITKVDPKAGSEKPKWKLKLATGGDTVFDFAPTSQIAANNNAVVAINGGYFAFGGAALGTLKIDGEWIRLPMKNRTAVGFDEHGGVLIDNLSAEILFRTFPPPRVQGMEGGGVISNLNGFAAPEWISVVTSYFGPSYKLREGEIAVKMRNGIATERIANGVVEIGPQEYLVIGSGEGGRMLLNDLPIGFRTELRDKSPDVWKKYPTILGAGPRLLKNGQIFTTEKEEEFRPDVLARGPRSAFGVDKDGHWIFLVCDGREKEYSAGLSIAELALEMRNAGAVDALCLDGGGSSTLAINGAVVNRPSDGTERKIPDAILVVPVEKKTP